MSVAAPSLAGIIRVARPRIRSASARATGSGTIGGDVAAELRHLLGQRRADVAVLERGHQEGGVDLGRELAVRERHLQLGLEVADRAQPAHDEAGAVAPREVDGQAVERVDADVLAEVRDAAPDEVDALVDAEQRRFFGLFRTPMTSRSNRPEARRATSRCAFVIGSNDPGKTATRVIRPPAPRR